MVLANTPLAEMSVMKTPSFTGDIDASSTPKSERYGAVKDIATPSISVAIESDGKCGIRARRLS
jgi:hypothetical protein